MTNNDSKEWLSTRDVAREVGMQAEWVRQQIKAGRLAATFFQIDGRRTYRIHRQDLKRFLIRYQRDGRTG